MEELGECEAWLEDQEQTELGSRARKGLKLRCRSGRVKLS